MKMLKNLLFPAVLFFFVSSQNLFAQSDAALGTWFNEEKDAKIEVYKTTGGKYAGKITWLKDPNDTGGQPKTDTKNPEKSLQSRKIMGLVFMEGFTFDGKNTWEGGKIYDAKSGKTYNSKMTLKDKNTLDVRGYIGAAWMGMGRTSTWTRAN
jgi:uncharacterized protein (DUF2147 family)